MLRGASTLSYNISTGAKWYSKSTYQTCSWLSSLAPSSMTSVNDCRRPVDNNEKQQWQLHSSTSVRSICTVMGQSSVPKISYDSNNPVNTQVRTLVIPPLAYYRGRSRGGLWQRRRMVPTTAPRGRPPVQKIPNGNEKLPNLDEVQNIPTTMEKMDNSTLVILGELGDGDAREEILKRHIMAKDRVSYREACETFAVVAEKNQEGQYLLSLPYHIGITVALTAAAASFPLCFHQATAEWFNATYVTTDVPEPEDLETWLEIGAWTWNWMEPPLGQISFVLLCLQFSRSQLDNLGIKPYTQRIKRWRAEHLASLFPQYDSRIIMNYSESTGMVEARNRR